MHSENNRMLATMARRASAFLRHALTSLLFLLAGHTASGQTSPHGAISFACEVCHSPASWKQMTYPSKFEHRKTGFALKGQHALVKCTACHTKLNFKGVAKSCVECHDDAHRGELGAACDRCHSPESWLVPDMIQRHSKTRFSLVGAHAAVSCQACHKNEQKHTYVGVRTDCFGCHASDYSGSKSPNHRIAGFSTDCTLCHTVTAMRWGGSFDHNRTGFPLVAAHAATPCSQCHPGNVFRGTNAQCFSCHQPQYNAAASPKHAGFPTDCVSCHTMYGWRPASFDHSKTLFALTGAHQAVACLQCHKNNVYAGTPTVCYSCHQQDYLGVANPKHAPGFSTVCTTCHTTSAWMPASFDHTKANFVLTGAHVTVPCASCHKNGIYTGTPRSCGDAACHLTTYNATTNPNHAAAVFPMDCSQCHKTTAWVPSTYNHDPFFPISGSAKHRPGTWNVCTDCHTVPTNFATFSCIDCHKHQPQSVVDGQHKGRTGYSYTSAACYKCHPRGVN